MTMLTQRRRVRFDLTDDTIKPRFVDGQELPNWQDGPEMVDYITHLVQEGWNLTSGNGQLLIFERQEE
jgi:hypothetical protein